MTVVRHISSLMLLKIALIDFDYRVKVKITKSVIREIRRSERGGFFMHFLSILCAFCNPVFVLP